LTIAQSPISEPTFLTHYRAEGSIVERTLWVNEENSVRKDYDHGSLQVSRVRL